MYESFFIVFRECLEMSLIVGIILAYLKRTKQEGMFPTVYGAIGSGIASSLVVAYLFSMFLGGFSGQNEELFEGVIMISAAVLLTSMIFWFMKQGSVRKQIENSIDSYQMKWSSLGVFLIVFLSILREGVETVLFMSAVFLKGVDVASAAIGGFGGMVLAMGIGYAIFVAGKHVCLRKFFLVSNIVLVLFAAGLLAHGVHELQEAGVVPIVVEHLYDINHLFDEKSVIGSLFKAVFGYNGNPSLIEVGVYMGYLAMVAAFVNVIGRKKELAEEKA